jgi:hypothetical protein
MTCHTPTVSDESDRLGLDGQAPDRLRTVASAAIGMVPIIGPALSGALEIAWPEVWRARVNRLFAEIDGKVAKLETWRVEQESVATVAALAAQQAVASDDEKIIYLANAVANTARSEEWKHDAAAMLIRLVGELTATHIRVLRFLAAPEAWIKTSGVLLEQPERADGYHLSDTVELAFERAGEPIADVILILHDLQARSLLSADKTGNAFVQQRPHSLDEHMVSALGHRLLLFVLG